MEPHIIQLKLSLEQAQDDDQIHRILARQLKKDPSNIQFRWKKHSIDARRKKIIVNGSFEVISSDADFEVVAYYQPIALGTKTVHIIGAGPAGLFAALRALEQGVRPIIFERGKDVRSRRRDLAALNKEHVVNPESNYCFGEGGAGTYSDGKLYTRSKKRGDVEKVLGMFVHFGADENIQVHAHPHIGTNKLPQLIVSMREEIIARGGAVHFESKWTDLTVQNGRVQSIEINGEETHEVDNLMVATGHSARDVFELLHKHKIAINAKPFALGVRVEHRQAYIDEMQYHGRLSDQYLPPASYSLVTQVADKGVFSFCMCPGGIIAPCATAPGEVVTNGWSPSKRNNPYANSGIVVGVDPQDVGNPENPFVCLDFQRKVERDCWGAAGKTQAVPAQRLEDFVRGKLSKEFPRSSYQPGVVSVNLREILPDFIAQRLVRAFKHFDKKMPGFVTNDAVVHAPESRTSSPIQIPRDRETWQHPQVSNLFPVAEGAGYAGGIVSAAIDGMNAMDKITAFTN